MIPVLYTFRRCPYAMRARWAIHVAGVAVQQVEVSLRAKPAAMLAASPKGTVPVLMLLGGEVIDQSLDIMLWALAQSDPEGWLAAESGTLDEQLALIGACERDFKPHLDRYKYPVLFKPVAPVDQALAIDTPSDLGESEPSQRAAEQHLSDTHFELALRYLNALNDRLQTSGASLFGPRPALADFAIVPFVRQFARHDAMRFAHAAPPAVAPWMERLLSRPDFLAIMEKGP